MSAGDEYAVQIGRLSIAFARVDYYLRGIVVELVDPEHPEVGAAVLQRRTSSQILELARQLIPLRAGDQRVSPLVADLNEAVTQADAVRAFRNRCLHSIWMAFPGQPTATLLNERGHDNMSLTRLENHVERTEAAGEVVSSVWERLAHAFGAFDALVAATREMAGSDWDDWGDELA